DPKLPRHMHRLTMPTMLVWGNNDKLTPSSQHKAWMRALPRATIRLFDDAGHVVLDEAPAAVTAIGELFGPRSAPTRRSSCDGPARRRRENPCPTSSTAPR